MRNKEKCCPDMISDDPASPFIAFVGDIKRCLYQYNQWGEDIGIEYRFLLL